MRKEILRKRNDLRQLIEDVNEAERVCTKQQSFELGKLKSELKKKYNFLNKLLKVI